jgi:hypothetical protein
MKIIDQTPFYNNETGEISILGRDKAIMKFGTGWIKEVEAQKLVIAVLDKALDEKYTLLRNFTPPDLDIMIPFILIGPTGVFVMSVNPRPGLFVASGDQWGVISEGTLQPEKPNLLTRTEWLAHAIQVLLQQPGSSDLTGVEAVLLCPDPFTSVDDNQPIIRVVTCDALEPFAVSIAQTPFVHDPESVVDIVNRILNPPASAAPGLVETAAATPASPDAQQVIDSSVPAFSMEEAVSTPTSAGVPASPDELIQPASPPASAVSLEAEHVDDSSVPAFSMEEALSTPASAEVPAPSDELIQPASQPEATPALPEEEQASDSSVPAFSMEQAVSTPASKAVSAFPDWLELPASPPAATAVSLEAEHVDDSSLPAFSMEEVPPTLASSGVPASPDKLFQPASPSAASPQITPPVSRRRGITGKQWAFLIILFVILCLIVAVLAYLFARDILPQLSLIK